MSAALPLPSPGRPRLGFVGVGWTGRMRLQSLVEANIANVVAVADGSGGALEEACRLVPGASVYDDLAAVIGAGVDGVVLATPRPLHGELAHHVLAAGLPVFCQKPLARNARETSALIAEARAHDRLLALERAYRHLRAVQAVRELVQGGALGSVFAVNLVFHSAYGPDQAWFHDARLARVGCLIDRGTHLLDAALWILGWPVVESISGRTFSQGRLLPPATTELEDFAAAQLTVGDGTLVSLACSWRFSAGCDSLIELAFHGTRGAAVARNVNGSFHDFVAEHHVGRERRIVCEPPDAWGGRALVSWASALSQGTGFDAEVEHATEVARVIDCIYGRST
jgi:predicted dehydrogenase